MRASKHWLHQRISAIITCFCIPGLWWLFNVINTCPYICARTQIASPSVLILMLIAVIFTFYHARLGLRVVVEDYVENSKRKIFFVAINTIIGCFLCFFLSAFILFFIRN
ncbi:MAG: succinate dehydrogenase, hydrophobic membrane anchor protein [Pseudomonadota bacterium]